MSEISSNPLPLAVKPKAAAVLLSVGLTRVYELLNAGEIVSFRDGRSRLITTESICRLIERRVAATNAPKAA